MYLLHNSTATLQAAVIERLKLYEFGQIAKSNRFLSFDWRKEKGREVFKIRLNAPEKILGLMSLEDHAEERWIKINLLESSVENVGAAKEYDHIAGCLIAYACRLAFLRGYDGCVALLPKTELIAHYMDIYGFEVAGKHLYTELSNSYKLIKKYLI